MQVTGNKVEKDEATARFIYIMLIRLKTKPQVCILQAQNDLPSLMETMFLFTLCTYGGGGGEDIFIPVLPIELTLTFQTPI